MLRRLVAGLAGLALAAPVVGEELFEPGTRFRVIDTPHLRAYVPARQAEALKPLVARAETIFVAMAAQSGYRPRGRLNLLLSDGTDLHNGFSTVIPLNLVEVDLAPAPPVSGIFDGVDHVERTLIHEFAHHISNDRNHGFRGGLETVFGRILPNDPLSLLAWYLSTPAHVTMPSFWHEGVAQWAETVYADPASPWAGRGRDPLTHLVWRLDAAHGGIPPVGDWRLSNPRWPFGNAAYLYGIAYTRYLDAAYGAQANVWSLVDVQARQWAFSFTDGPDLLLGKDHRVLLAEARAALQAEQEIQLARIRAKPVTATTRLTPAEGVVGAPAWTRDGKLFFPWNGKYERPTYATVDAHGDVDGAFRTAWAMGPARSLPDGTLIYAEIPGTVYSWVRSRVVIVPPDRSALTLAGERLIQPDLQRRWSGATTRSWRVAAVRLAGAGRQELVLGEATLRDGAVDTLDQEPWSVLPTQGRAWSPAFRPWRDEVAWVETDASGSRLVLAPFANPERRTVLAEVRGRILHPAWNPDGTELFFCADHSGVPNAYVVAADQPGRLTAVTNTIGGIVACVPSPDGRELALVEHDRRGPYLARIANDPATRPGTVPGIALAWPAPVGAPPVLRPAPLEADLPAPGAHPVSPLPATPADAGKDLQDRPYRGLAALRPRFWTPTTFAVPEGGLGVIGVATDPLFTHTAVASAGIGMAEATPIGMAGYAYSGWPVEFAVLGWQAERSYNQLLIDSTGSEWDYTERIATGEVRVGRGLTGFRTRFQAWAAAGVADWRTVEAGSDEYAGRTILTQTPFRGSERYVEGVLAYDDAFLFPTSYAPENGLTGSLTLRRSAFGGDLERDRALGRGQLALATWPSLGQQLVVRGVLGWSRFDQITQGTFTIGGILGQGIPRGYRDAEAGGRWLTAGSIAYRAALWRPFKGYGSSPWMHRQVVAEVFYDAAEVSSDRWMGDGAIYASVGGELHDSWEFYGFLLQPGIGVAKQLDGEEDTVFYFSLGFGM